MDDEIVQKGLVCEGCYRKDCFAQSELGHLICNICGHENVNILSQMDEYSNAHTGTWTVKRKKVTPLSAKDPSAKKRKLHLSPGQRSKIVLDTLVEVVRILATDIVKAIGCTTLVVNMAQRIWSDYIKALNIKSEEGFILTVLFKHYQTEEKSDAKRKIRIAVRDTIAPVFLSCRKLRQGVLLPDIIRMTRSGRLGFENVLRRLPLHFKERWSRAGIGLEQLYPVTVIGNGFHGYNRGGLSFYTRSIRRIVTALSNTKGSFIMGGLDSLPGVNGDRILKRMGNALCLPHMVNTMTNIYRHQAYPLNNKKRKSKSKKTKITDVDLGAILVIALQLEFGYQSPSGNKKLKIWLGNLENVTRTLHLEESSSSTEHSEKEGGVIEISRKVQHSWSMGITGAKRGWPHAKFTNFTSLPAINLMSGVERISHAKQAAKSLSLLPEVYFRSIKKTFIEEFAFLSSLGEIHGGSSEFMNPGDSQGLRDYPEVSGSSEPKNLTDTKDSEDSQNNGDPRETPEGSESRGSRDSGRDWRFLETPERRGEGLNVVKTNNHRGIFDMFSRRYNMFLFLSSTLVGVDVPRIHNRGVDIVNEMDGKLYSSAKPKYSRFSAIGYLARRDNTLNQIDKPLRYPDDSDIQQHVDKFVESVASGEIDGVTLEDITSTMVRKAVEKKVKFSLKNRKNLIENLALSAINKVKK